MSVAERFREAVSRLNEGKDDDVPAGGVKAIPGKGAWKAKNKRGTVRVFTNTQRATEFAAGKKVAESAELSETYSAALAAVLAERGVASVKDIPEDQVSEFFAQVDSIYSKGE